MSRRDRGTESTHGFLEEDEVHEGGVDFLVRVVVPVADVAFGVDVLECLLEDSAHFAEDLHSRSPCVPW